MNKQNLYFLLIAISLTSLLTVADNAIAEKIQLKSGKVLKGKITEKTKERIKIDTGLGIPITYFADEIETINGYPFPNKYINKFITRDLFDLTIDLPVEMVEVKNSNPHEISIFANDNDPRKIQDMIMIFRKSPIRKFKGYTDYEWLDLGYSYLQNDKKSVSEYLCEKAFNELKKMTKQTIGECIVFMAQIEQGNKDVYSYNLFDENKNWLLGVEITSRNDYFVKEKESDYMISTIGFKGLHE